MEDLKKIAADILEKGYLMSLATVDDGGVWVSDVGFVHDENLNVYWMSHEQTRHSQAIVRNSKVAATITISNTGEPNLGLQIAGKAERFDGNIFDLAAKSAAKRHKPTPQKDEANLPAGRAWYKLTPELMEVINEPLWGFKKQKLEL